MKNYGAMRFIAGVLQVIGWLTVLFGIAAAVITAGGGPNVYGTNAGAASLIAFLVGGGIALTGMFTVASGQLITAIADIATNSWYLRSDSEKTVGFFERVSNARAQS